MITLVLGGARSGKSAVAERRVGAFGESVVYVATAEVTDDDFADRVESHRQRRPAMWSTIECGDVPRVLRRHPAGPMLVDSLGTWIARQADFAVDVDELVAAATARRGPTVFVSEEAGLGVHPESAAGRRWRDVLGQVNQAVAAVADEVLLVVAGRVIEL
jgi:adenosylcobinamide kinase / adenosylcobinamide-phosphate guanylyltransferase